MPWLSITNVAVLGVLGDEVEAESFEPSWIYERARHSLVLGGSLGVQSPERTLAVYLQESPDQGEYAFLDNQDAIGEWVAESGDQLRTIDDLTLLHALTDKFQDPQYGPRVGQEELIYWTKLCFLYGCCFGATQPQLFLRLLAATLATTKAGAATPSSWRRVAPASESGQARVAAPSSPEEALESALTLITHYEADFGPMLAPPEAEPPADVPAAPVKPKAARKRAALKTRGKTPK